jgi:surface antigen
MIKCLFSILILIAYGCEPIDITTDYVKNYNVNPGDSIDSYNNITVYYNGNIKHGRNTTADGYNLGLKYQCVEYVKRYYYYRFNHKMPNPWGHAKDFYNSNISDGSYNKQRGLIQYNQGSVSKPKVDDILVFDWGGKYGHVAIVSDVTNNTVEIVQQNVGKRSRESMTVYQIKGKWYFVNASVKCWLRKR